MEPLKQIVSKTSLTTHDRVLKETSQLASKLAEQLNCTKQELYSWLVKWAMENGEALAQGQIIVSRKDTTK